MRLPLALVAAVAVATPATAQFYEPVTAFTQRPSTHTLAAWLPAGAARPPVDQYGPNPDGMALGNGQVVRCKLKRKKDRYYGGHVVRRVCWLG